MAPARFAQQIAKLMPPRCGPHILRNPDPFVECRPNKIITAKIFDQAIFDFVLIILSNKSAEHLVPDDEDPGIICVKIARIGCMVDAVMRGRVEYRFEPAGHFINRLGMEPELIDQVERAAEKHHLNRKADPK